MSIVFRNKLKLIICLAVMLKGVCVHAQSEPYIGGAGKGDANVFLQEYTLSGIALSDIGYYLGSSGKGDAFGLLEEGNMNGQLQSSFMYFGGNGKGDARTQLDSSALYNLWEVMSNNRVVTRDAFRSGWNAGYFNASGTRPSGLRTINKTAITTYAVSPLTSGLTASAIAKTDNQELIRGDFRSIRISTAAGQTACATQGTYGQLLWLDRDVIITNVTKCYSNKTLTTLYTSGNGSDWYNIRGGGAIKINATGTVTDLSCATGLGLVVDLDASDAASYPGTGTTWVDLSGNGNNATLTNGPTYDTTAGGNFVFDGVNDCAYRSSLNNTLTTTLSYNVWVRHTGDVGPNRYVMALGRDVSGASGGMALISYGFSSICSGQVQFEVGSAAGRVCSGVTPALGTWVNYCTTMDGTNTRFYINGVLQATAAQGAGAVTSNPGFSVGAYLNASTPPSPTQYWFRGNIARVSVYNRALSATEVLNNFNATKSRYGL